MSIKMQGTESIKKQQVHLVSQERTFSFTHEHAGSPGCESWQGFKNNFNKILLTVNIVILALEPFGDRKTARNFQQQKVS